MSNDNSSTIFNPSNANSDHDVSPDRTIIKPNPGRRLQQDSPSHQQPQISDYNQPAGFEQPPLAHQHQFSTPIRIESKLGNNPILFATTTLTAVLSSLRNASAPPNLLQLQQELAVEIRNMDARLQTSGVRQEVALIARYILCSALDEAVTSTPWGANSGWSQRSLLRIYHNETGGGEKFFILLDQIMPRATEFRDLVEFFYVLISLGFQGRYHFDPRGRERLDDIRERLYNQLYGNQPVERALSTQWRTPVQQRNRVSHFIPLWVVLSIALATTVLTYSGLRIWMHNGTQQVADQFEKLYRDSMSDKQ